MLLMSTDAIGHRLAQHQNAFTAAVEAGMSHVVYASMPAPEGSPVLLAPEHAVTEAANMARDDLARAAAVVLAGNSTGKSTYTVSGAEALTTAQQGQAIMGIEPQSFSRSVDATKAALTA